MNKFIIQFTILIAQMILYFLIIIFSSANASCTSYASTGSFTPALTSHKSPYSASIASIQIKIYDEHGTKCTRIIHNITIYDQLNNDTMTFYFGPNNFTECVRSCTITIQCEDLNGDDYYLVNNEYLHMMFVKYPFQRWNIYRTIIYKKCNDSFDDYRYIVLIILCIIMITIGNSNIFTKNNNYE